MLILVFLWQSGVSAAVHIGVVLNVGCSSRYSFKTISWVFLSRRCGDGRHGGKGGGTVVATGLVKATRLRFGYC